MVTGLRSKRAPIGTCAPPIRIFSYNITSTDQDGQRLTVTHHEGNSDQYTFDTTNPDPLQRGNLLQITRLPDSERSGDQARIVTSYSYEPIYGQRRTVTEARGNDAQYRSSVVVPDETALKQRERYTTRYFFDYQEGTDYAGLAGKLGVTVEKVKALLEQADIPMGLGDLNGDGRNDQIAGNIVRIEHPQSIFHPGPIKREPKAVPSRTSCSYSPTTTSANWSDGPTRKGTSRHTSTTRREIRMEMGQ